MERATNVKGEPYLYIFIAYLPFSRRFALMRTTRGSLTPSILYLLMPIPPQVVRIMSSLRFMP